MISNTMLDWVYFWTSEWIFQKEGKRKAVEALSLRYSLEKTKYSETVATSFNSAYTMYVLVAGLFLRGKAWKIGFDAISNSVSPIYIKSQQQKSFPTVVVVWNFSYTQ